MGKRTKKSAVLLLVVSVFCLFVGPNVHAFRCGDEIVGTGDSKAKVLIKCGKPTFQEKIGVKKGSHATGEKRGTTKNQQAYNTKHTTAKGVEKWSYNCGKDDFIYVLTFEGGVVTKIDTDGRGRGASECLGR
jgi:hypothetical protein